MSSTLFPPLPEASTTAAAPTVSLSESKFGALKTQLRQLFELDKSDLDFGIYRIMAAKNKEVTEFLDRQLKDVVRQSLTEHGVGATDQVQIELDKAIAQAIALGADPGTLPKVIELKAKLASVGGASLPEIEADIYNHLLAFFSRYYDEGDFISKRRYKGDVYAIPYGGEEVTLHWANKDQYYIKSGEWHKDYRFKVGTRTVHFKLVQATQETNNNKESDDARRRYVLIDTDPVEELGTELILRFEFRVPSESQKIRAANGTVAIFGGKFASTSKGDEREQFCADAEQRAIAATPATWRAALSAAAATETKPLRTLLGKHLDNFTARNTFDYFIHKDLGGFLRRELDFYIKNEVVRLDDLEKLPPDHLARMQGKVKAIRTVAGRTIDFLASLENFQKKLWLKKKLVLNTNWLVTIDRISDRLRDTVAANEEQWKEWEGLGFKPADDDSMLVSGPRWGTRAYLDANDKLVVDTRLFDSVLKSDIVSSDSVLGGQSMLDDAVMAILVHGENFQAMTALQCRYRNQIKLIYIDPPYNTGNDGFVYKDRYDTSSWLTMLFERLQEGRKLASPGGSIFVSIDDWESSSLKSMLCAVYGEEQFIAQIIWKKRSTPPNDKVIGAQHEYIIGFAVDHQCLDLNLRERGADRLAQYTNPDNHPKGPYVLGDLQANVKGGRYVASLSFAITNPVTGEEHFPRNKGNWRFNKEKIERLIKSNEIAFGSDGRGWPKLKRFLCDVKEGITYTTLWDFLPMNSVGSEELANMFGDTTTFENPKPTGLIAELCRLGSSDESITLDYFAGSGTTGHAVINLNREDGGSRRFVLVEMGAYFHSLLKPRMTKALYSPDWREGKAASHGKGVSALVKYFAFESYDDALNNLPSPGSELLAGVASSEKDALITYSLDLEMGPNLLNLDAFRDPWALKINAQPAGEVEIRPHSVDLVETFNYLIGLKVSSYGPMERYSAEFERVAHEEGMGLLKVKGRLRRDPVGPFVFHRVEGELNDREGTRVLIVWRKITGDAEQDAAALDAWMSRHREDTRQRSEHRDYQITYINGPVTLPQPTAEIRSVFPIEETFKHRMFEDTDSTAGSGGGN
jgi:adenine-specific DNA-methyltransferase